MNNTRKYNIDIPDTKGTLLTTEDKILCVLVKEKGLSKYDLLKLIDVNYNTIRLAITKMQDKGYVVERIVDNDSVYYLTAAGMYELEYRRNLEVFENLHLRLVKQGYNNYQVASFLKNRFYRFYIAGTWDNDTLEEQYAEWCYSNDLDPYESNKLKLKR